jgi:hypothetical protein
MDHELKGRRDLDVWGSDCRGGLSGADFALPQSLTRKFESLRLDKDRLFPRSLSIASLLP